jgi:GT2 family glycosyltransferase
VASRDTEPAQAIVALARNAMERGSAALAAHDITGALRWLERAHRLAPQDANATLALATACLAEDPHRAEALFADIAARYDVRQAWLGVAAARLRLAGPDAAEAPLAMALSCHAFVPDITALAEQVAGGRGWCGVCHDGRVMTGASGRVRVTLDGVTVAGRAMPAGWAQGRRVEVWSGDRPLLGSPIRIDAIRRLEGCVEIHDGGLRGWAWHPGDPETDPALTVTYSDGRAQRLIARDGSAPVALSRPLARPRSFRLNPADLLDTPGPVRVAGPDGHDLLGSPLDPFAAVAEQVAAARSIAAAYPSRTAATHPLPATTLRADAPVPVRPVGADRRRRAATVVIPVHGGGPVVLDCLASVLASESPPPRVLVVDDASSDPATVEGLDALVRRGRITLLRHRSRLGFPASANAGIRAAKGRDVALLNSDTLVPAGWLTRLREAAYSAPDIGTVTPLSNEATILSYPGPSGSNRKPDQAATDRLDRLAARANGGAVVDIPVGVGFCLYLRRDCLNAVGVFRADLFAQGYGEENDLSLRARRLGWRNVALTGLFVGHLGGVSFGGSADHLRRRNGRIIEQLHPGHDTLIARFVASGSLAEARRRIDLLEWRERSRGWRQVGHQAGGRQAEGRHSVILLTHDDGGGVEDRVRLAAQAHAKAGRRPVLLRPAKTASGEPAVAVRDAVDDDLPNLIFALPREMKALLRLLRAGRPDRIEAHHLADHQASVYDLIAQLAVPYEVFVHDYAWFCPRVSLVGADNRYCGEPDLPHCEACVADHGHFLKETIGVAELRQRSDGFLRGAGRVVAPAEDAAVRMRRHFPALATVTVPHEDDRVMGRRGAASAGSGALVCVVGAIGVHKGYEVLLACARDAARRALDLAFVVVGHTIDDHRMMQTGRVFVTGQFSPDEAVALIVRQNARIGFVPSVCPETWCLSLGHLWQSGLDAVAFDIGAPAERIRQTRRGFVLPLGIPANAINNRLVAAMRSAGHR